MISKAEIIEQPYSGQFEERIYDIPNQSNTQDWTWIKFENADFNEWCGQFRGAQRAVALSKKYNKILVLTSDYLFQIDCLSGELTEYESINETGKIYQDLTVTPCGDFIIADYYNIEKIGVTINNRQLFENPIAMDMIKFNGWSNNKLTIICEEIGIIDSKVTLELNEETSEITVLKIKYY